MGRNLQRYRYGPDGIHTVRIKPIRRKLSERQRTRLSRRVANIMRRALEEGAPSKFAYEAACRTGLRAGLCLAGWAWHEADHAAKDVTLRALSQVGATTRPTWREGQPEYTLEGVIPDVWERCARCGGKLPEDSTRKYCSTLCKALDGGDRVRAQAKAERMAEKDAAISVSV